MKYAIIESGGKQFRAVEGGTIEVDRMPVKTGDNIKLEKVLLLADGENITVGTPHVKDMPVWTTVLEHTKGPKVEIFNYSPKKRIRTKIGHRQNYTRLFVDQIGGSELVKKEPVIEEIAAPVKKVEKASKKKEDQKKEPVKAESKTVQASPKTKKPAVKAPAKAATKPTSRKTAASKPAAKPTPKRTTSTKGKAAPKKPAAKK
jgi:large subunit ribosomal protein L21